MGQVAAVNSEILVRIKEFERHGSYRKWVQIVVGTLRVPLSGVALGLRAGSKIAPLRHTECAYYFTYGVCWMESIWNRDILL